MSPTQAELARHPLLRCCFHVAGDRILMISSAPSVMPGRCATLTRVMSSRRRAWLIWVSRSTSRCAVPSSRNRIRGRR
jgi:hypothetical protein